MRNPHVLAAAVILAFVHGCALLVAPAPVAAQRPIEATDLYRLRIAGSVAVSPDGRSVVYSVTRADSSENRYERELWIAAADGSSPPRPLTSTAGASESQPAFSPDGRWLAFVSRREPDEASQIYLLPLTLPGEARAVTSVETGASSPVWAPDSRRLAFTSDIAPDTEVARDSTADEPVSIREKLRHNAEDEDPRVVTRLDYLAETSIADEEWQQIFVLDALVDGAEATRITRGEYGHGAPTWTADGRSLIYGAGPPLGDYHADYERDSDLWIVAADGSTDARPLTGDDRPEGWRPPLLPVPGEPAPYGEYAPSISPDGRWLAFARSGLGAHFTATESELVIARPDGSAGRCVTCGLDRGPNDFHWDPRTGDLFFTVSDRGSVPLYRVAPDGGEPRRVLGGARGVLGFDVAGGTLAWEQMMPARPSDVYAATPDGEAERRLTALNDSLLAAVYVQPYEELTYRAADGTEIQGWVIHAPEPIDAAVPGPPPLAVEIHGGPHAMWGPGEQSMWLEYQLLAGAGYTVFFSNPRGSGGYGDAWMRAIYRDWGDLPMNDVLAGADAVLARGWADPDRQVVTGGSYAGYLTAWVIGRTDRFDAAVTQRGVYDMLGWYGGSNTWRLFEGEFGTFPWREPMLAFEASPIALVENVTTPLLIIHGEQDFRTTIATAEIYYRALKVL
ncbi:MAG: S9 family peptidase, partial [Longimicrobiales bacterium]